jgi:MoaA/NifB/PqqE/SkfB family radical SAM enzyme
MNNQNFMDPIATTFDLMVCIGDGSLTSDQQTRALAEKLNLPYRLVLDSDTDILPGVYHTSIYDIKLSRLYEKIKNFKTKIHVLNISKELFKNAEDFVATMFMINNLEQHLSVEYSAEREQTWFFSQLKDNKAMCIMPFIGAWQFPKLGSHCCHMPDIWGSQNDFFGGKSQQIRQKILEGTRVAECRKCYELDDNGAQSDRVLWSYQWASRLGIRSLQDLNSNTNIKFYHLNLDNQCNLLCRMCSPNSSSLIAKEYTKLKLYQPDKIKSTSRDFMRNVDISQLKEIVVSGGEPTINSKFLDFLESLIQTEHQNLNILISTNGVTLTPRMKKIINQLPNLVFSVSIDGFDRVNHYIRWPANWNKLVKNINYFYKQNKLSHFNTTVSIYNIAQLHDLYTWIDHLDPKIACSMNFVGNPDHMTPWNYPDKSQVYKSLEEIKQLSIYKFNQNLQSYITYIESKMSNRIFDKEKLRKFYQFNDLLDNSRKVALKDYIEPLESLRFSL